MWTGVAATSAISARQTGQESPTLETAAWAFRATVFGDRANEKEVRSGKSRLINTFKQTAVDLF
ncbi:hypothetical protein BC938DRAFT_478761 [Jimgerdemannia flammicorona]|uniref:Uncharacterized protein n=1 Tax=Jimgerdemannia flammicorona TaxID=994334 RepID=A0A433QME5_9FUNG|nr:hypothetical protein BC938DRAFT_478761 [Jimgerdemannia flammicorona]